MMYMVQIPPMEDNIPLPRQGHLILIWNISFTPFLFPFPAPCSFLDDGLDEATQHVRNQQLRDLGGGWRGPPPFQGDSENHPPLAWDLTWEHFFTDWYAS